VSLTVSLVVNAVVVFALTAILGLGSAPGKTNLLAAAAARRLGSDPVSMEIWAATRDPAAAGHPFPAPYSVQTLRDELQVRPVVLREGGLEEIEPLSGAATRDFPEPVGSAEGIFTLHSELATLPVSLVMLRALRGSNPNLSRVAGRKFKVIRALS